MPYTEQQIRGLALNFLRFYYKLRPRLGGSATRIVDRPHYYEGVLIDARLAFQEPDGTWFTATVEATSVDRTDEVFYQINYWRVAIHAGVLALVATAGLLWWPGTELWRRFGNPEAGLLLLGFFGTAFAVLMALLSQWRGYRYLYAVDQFKRFYAGAQWVAYDVQLFAADTRRSRSRYAELERQCIKYGFGMLAVGADSVVRNVMSPSQVDQFSGRRLRLPEWMARARVQRLPVARRIRVGKRAQRWAVRLRVKLRRAYRSLFPGARRRRPGYYELGAWVWILALPALLLVVAGTYRQASYSPVAREGKRGAGPDLSILESTTDPAPPLEVEEGEYVPLRDTVELTPPPVIVPPEAPLVAVEKIEDLSDLRRYRIGVDGGVTVDYDCVPLDELDGPVFILLFGRYASFGAAREWAEELNRLYRSSVTVAVGTCVARSENETDYLLYLDGPLTDEGDVNLRLRALLREGLAVEILEIDQPKQ